MLSAEGDFFHFLVELSRQEVDTFLHDHTVTKGRDVVDFHAVQVF